MLSLIWIKNYLLTSDISLLQLFMDIKSYDDELEGLYQLWREVAKERANSAEKDITEFKKEYLKTPKNIDCQCFTIHKNSKIVGASILKLRENKEKSFLDFLVPKERLHTEGAKELLKKSIGYCKEQAVFKITLSPNIYPQEVIDFFKKKGFKKSDEYPFGLWMKRELRDLPDLEIPEGIDIFAVEDLEGPILAKDLAEVHLDYVDKESFDLEDIIDQFKKMDEEKEDIFYCIAKQKETDEIVGFSRTVFVDLIRADNIAQNVGLVVKEDNRKKGIGNALLVDSFHRAKERGYKKMYISTHSKNPAQKLYRRVGFELKRKFPNLCYEIEET